nr:unnamed protein product [Digitaria exilis]
MPRHVQFFGLELHLPTQSHIALFLSISIVFFRGLVKPSSYVHHSWSFPTINITWRWNLKAMDIPKIETDSSFSYIYSSHWRLPPRRPSPVPSPTAAARVSPPAPRQAPSPCLPPAKKKKSQASLPKQNPRNRCNKENSKSQKWKGQISSTGPLSSFSRRVSSTLTGSEPCISAMNSSASRLARTGPRLREGALVAATFPSSPPSAITRSEPPAPRPSSLDPDPPLARRPSSGVTEAPAPRPSAGVRPLPGLAGSAETLAPAPLPPPHAAPCVTLPYIITLPPPPTTPPQPNMSSTRRLVAPAFNKAQSLRRRLSSTASSPSDETAADVLAGLHQERALSSATLSLLRAKPGLADELYALIAESGKKPHAPLAPASLAILHSLAACHRIAPSSASLLSRLLARFRCPADAASFLRDSLAAGAPAPGVSAFNSLLAALGRAGNLRGMTELFTSMTGASVQPDVVTYGILLNGLCKAGRAEEALKVLDGMSRPGSHGGFGRPLRSWMSG